MPFDEHGNGYGAHEGLYDPAQHITLEVAPFVDTGYAKVNAHLDDDEIERIADAVAQKWKGEDEDRPSTFWDVTSAQVHAHTAATMLILKQMDEIQRLKKLTRQQDALLSRHGDTVLENERAHLHQRYVQVMEGEQG